MEVSSDYDFAGAQHGRRFKSIILTYISTLSHLFSPADLDDGRAASQRNVRRCATNAMRSNYAKRRQFEMIPVMRIETAFNGDLIAQRDCRPSRYVFGHLPANLLSYGGWDQAS
jgi:hypothetical protein